MDPKKVKRGRKSKAQGSAFELRVRKDLEEKGWIVDKWSNNIEDGKLIVAKAHMVFNPIIKRMIPLQRSSGFPDFECRRQVLLTKAKGPLFEVIGVESKLTGDLDRAEKEKCKWLLNNGIFSKILIAEKTKVKNKVVIVYHDFKEKYKRFYEKEEK